MASTKVVVVVVVVVAVVAVVVVVVERYDAFICRGLLVFPWQWLASDLIVCQNEKASA